MVLPEGRVKGRFFFIVFALVLHGLLRLGYCSSLVPRPPQYLFCDHNCRKGFFRGYMVPLGRTCF